MTGGRRAAERKTEPRIWLIELQLECILKLVDVEKEVITWMERSK